MKIRTRARLLTAMALGVIGLVAASIWWTFTEVNVVNRQRQQVGEIALGLSQLRMVTFEYRLHHNERAKVQWFAISERVDRLLAEARTTIPAQDKLVARMRERRAIVRSLFVELTSARAGIRADAPLDGLTEPFEAQLLSRLLSEQQDNFMDVFRLTDIATGRIDDAQRQLLGIVLVGLALVAFINVAVSWLMERDVLAPIARLQDAAQQLTAGHRDVEFARGGSDEIGELSNNFDAMTKSLQKSVVQIERSNQDLSRINAELEAFSYSVSHDLRGPLRSMDGFSLALLEDYADKLDDEGKDSLRRIRAASQRMGALIDDLLRLSQVARAKLEVMPIDLSALAREIAADIDREPSGRPVVWAIESGLSIDADPALLGIALQNLLQNAWKFTGKTERPVIRVGAMQRDAMTVYFVADNGVGFDMAFADKLFGAFQRLHSTDDFPGTGIGLAIVQRIIHRHHGKIWADAKEDQGATFFFTLLESGSGPNEQDHPAG